MVHELPQLPYSYNALEPHIDAKTMEIHHSKHHQTYVNKLNDTLKNYPDLQLLSVEELMKSLDKIPSKIRKSVRNNGGGHYSHSFFWRILQQVQDNPNKEPRGAIAGVIKNKFGSFQKFKDKFSKEAVNLFGSGWVWLVLPARQNLDGGGNPADKELKIISTQGHDNPLMKGMKPLLVLDIWEHAYYLKYQNRRAEYVDAWWNVVNWDEVEKIYTEDL